MSLVDMKAREKFVPGQKLEKKKSDPAIDAAAQAYVTNPAKRKFVAGEFAKQIAEGGVDPGALSKAMTERLGPVVSDSVMAEVQKRIGKVASAKSDSEPGKVESKSPDGLVDGFVEKLAPELGIDPSQEKQEAEKQKSEPKAELTPGEEQTPVGGKTSEVMSQVEVPSVSPQEEQARQEVITAYSALLDQLCLDGPSLAPSSLRCIPRSSASMSRRCRRNCGETTTLTKRSRSGRTTTNPIRRETTHLREPS